MKVTDLPKAWQEDQDIAGDRAREYRMRIPLEDAARLAALAELYSEKEESEILNDIANTAISDLANMAKLGEEDGNSSEQ